MKYDRERGERERDRERESERESHRERVYGRRWTDGEDFSFNSS